MIRGLSEGCRDGGPLLVLGVGTSPPHPPAHGEPTTDKNPALSISSCEITMRNPRAEAWEIVGGPDLVRSNSFLGFAEQSVGAIEDAGATVLYALLIRKLKKIYNDIIFKQNLKYLINIQIQIKPL